MVPGTGCEVRVWLGSSLGLGFRKGGSVCVGVGVLG